MAGVQAPSRRPGSTKWHSTRLLRRVDHLWVLVDGLTVGSLGVVGRGVPELRATRTKFEPRMIPRGDQLVGGNLDHK
jgi:hypothetical protein